MKTVKLLLTLLAFALILPATGFAVQSQSNTQTFEVSAQKSKEKKAKKFSPEKLKKFEKKMAKKMAKIKKRFQKKGQDIDLSDPVDKWFWFWIFGWGAGLLLSILWTVAITGTAFWGLWTLAYLCWLFGTVSLVIWLIKKFGGDL